MSADTTTGTSPSPPGDDGFLRDPYTEWASAEGVPIHEDFGFDLLTVETAPWARYDARGCFAHTVGRGDFISNYVLEIDPTRRTRAVHHLYEAFFYVLAGHGATTVWLPDGSERSFEWGPKALFAIPLNCAYRLMNTDGTEPARLSCTTDAPLVLGVFHSPSFVFGSDATFPERTGHPTRFAGEGEHSVYNADSARIQNVWQTNFVHDLTSFRLYGLEGRGKGSQNVNFVLADGTMHSHVSQMPVGRYKKAHRHAAGTHVHAVDGEGFTLLWYEGDSEFRRFPWRHGFMYSPPFWMFHQHFNTGSTPARYLACSLGSRKYPFLALRRKSAEGAGAVSVREGGRQIEYEDQDPRVHRMFLDALDDSGVPSQMGDTFDEQALAALAPETLTGVIRTPRSTGPAV